MLSDLKHDLFSRLSINYEGFHLLIQECTWVSNIDSRFYLVSSQNPNFNASFLNESYRISNLLL